MSVQRSLSRMAEQVLSLILVLAAATIAVAAVHRELSSRSASGLMTRTGDLELQRNWQQFARFGVGLGESGAPAQLIEFGDLECPACRSFQLSTLSEVRSKYGKQLSVTFIHYPLSMHRFARPAAQAAECAAETGHFDGFVEAVYRGQDSLGLRGWSTFATEAGIGDTIPFAQCLKRQKSNARIDSGLAIAKRLKLPGTPTILLNGWEFPNPPSSPVLSSVIDAVLQGRDPKAAYRAALH